MGAGGSKTNKGGQTRRQAYRVDPLGKDAVQAPPTRHTIGGTRRQRKWCRGGGEGGGAKGHDDGRRDTTMKRDTESKRHERHKEMRVSAEIRIDVKATSASRT